jgi:hypothetical protein
MLLIIGALWSLNRVSAADPGTGEIQFNRDIRPILSENCFQCHGPDARERQAELRLDQRESAVAKRDQGAALVPGDAASSQALVRILSTDPDAKMPPEKSGKKLTTDQTALLNRWIEQGAAYEAHWSLVPPRRAALPEIKDKAWPRNSIDRFVLARLEREGLRPAPEAKRETWLRRVSLDLTGLPPTVKELADFLADQTPQAHEKVVDRLLASPHYGERMAMHWLDLARYADTNGYNNDEERTQWPWRDWVIDAFNRNLPYDQFVTEQLAGDLLPNPTLPQRIATAFNRNHVLTTEGGIIEEEYRVEYVADRVHTTATVFLGLSLQCARCHDHKFDPLTQRDYYSFFAFFNNIAERTVGYNQARVSEPLVKAPTQEQLAQLEQLNRRLTELEKQKNESEANTNKRLAAWEAQITKAPASAGGSVLSGMLSRFPLDETQGDKISDNVRPERRGTIGGKPKWIAGKVGGALEFDGQTHVECGDLGGFEHDDAFSIAAWVFPASGEPSTVLSKMDEAKAHRGYDVILEQGKVAMHIIHHWPDNGLKVIAKEPLTLRQWQHVVLAYDGNSKAAGIRLYVNGNEQPLEVTNDKLSGTGSIKTDKPFHLGRRTISAPFRGSLDDVRLYCASLSAQDAARLTAGEEIAPIADTIKTPAEERTEQQRRQLRQYFSEVVDTANREQTKQLGELTKQRAELEKAFPPVMVMQEMPAPRQTRILKRGQYDQPEDNVSANVPGSLPKLPAGAPVNRLGLAQWLVDPTHPLTARVAVNRWWQLLFGTGIVETVEDFGSQGAWPSHPELLDWLALEFREGVNSSAANTTAEKPSPWNVKALLKEIVLSATYRQSSRVTPELLERDPHNRLLARGPRFRLSAETLRDNALAVSGLLTLKIGGPSVKPYQPEGLWEDVSVERRVKYQPDKGPDLYRRSMYTFWKRTCPPPGMTAFDAPDRETCTIRRARTNTPLQALVLMNDPTYLEAARKFAERILHEGGADDQSRIQYAYRVALTREPRSNEQALVLALLGEARQKFAGASPEAEKFLRIGDSPRDEKVSPAELAAWTTLGSVILNLDETITKE